MSAVEKPVHLTLYVDPGEQVGDLELDQVTRRLRAEIRELNVESVEPLGHETVPEGAKSAEAITIGALAMTILPAAMPLLFDLLKTWSLRGDNRRVKIKTQVRDRSIELEYSGKMSQAELEQITHLLTS